jgi:hypothetical protein
MSISSLTRAASGSLVRTLWNRDRAAARRRSRRGFAPAIDALESRRALAITGVLSIGGNTVGSYFDAPTGVANLGDFVTVSIEGTKGTVIFNGVTDSKATSVADGTDIQTIEIVDASPDFQLTFTAGVTLANPVPYSSDGVIQLGNITTANVIRGINTVRGPLTLTAAPQEIETSAIHLYTFNDGTTKDLIGGLDGTLFNGATVSGGSLVLADISQTGANVQYMSMPAAVDANSTSTSYCSTVRPGGVRTGGISPASVVITTSGRPGGFPSYCSPKCRNDCAITPSARSERNASTMSRARSMTSVFA